MPRPNPFSGYAATPLASTMFLTGCLVGATLEWHKRSFALAICSGVIIGLRIVASGLADLTLVIVIRLVVMGGSSTATSTSLSPIQLIAVSTLENVIPSFPSHCSHLCI